MKFFVQDALHFALDSHGDQKYGDKLYSYHLEMVVSNVNAILEELEFYDRLPPRDIIDMCFATAWLHDTVEDTPVTMEDIAANFGQSIADHVTQLTKNPGISHSAMIHTICLEGSDVALIVKLADVRANLSESLKNLDDNSAKRLAKYQNALDLLELEFYRRFLRRTEKE